MSATSTASTTPSVPSAKILFLDSHPLSLLSGPAGAPAVAAITHWAVTILAAGHRIYVPEIVDYELRRELVRAGKTAGIAELDHLKARFRYAPITTETMLLAADLWARSRNHGTPTGDPKKLDINVILAAQAITAGRSVEVPEPNVIIVTSNVAHMTCMVTADLWQNIAP